MRVGRAGFNLTERDTGETDYERGEGERREKEKQRTTQLGRVDEHGEQIDRMMVDSGAALMAVVRVRGMRARGEEEAEFALGYER